MRFGTAQIVKKRRVQARKILSNKAVTGQDPPKGLRNTRLTACLKSTFVKVFELQRFTYLVAERMDT